MVERLQYLYDTCFSDSKEFSEFVFRHKFKPKNALWTAVDGQPVSALFIEDKYIYLGGVKLRCPYIWGVCTHPDYRRKGLAEALMQQAHSLLLRRGATVCALHPFKHSYYQKMGYNTYTRVNEYKVSGAKDCGLYTLRASGRGEEHLLLKLYEEFMSAYNGYVVRDIKKMRYAVRELTADGRIDIISLSGKDIGYIARDNEGFIAEFCCADTGVLLSVPQLNGFIVNLPYGAPLGTPVDFTMIKMLNRPAFLRSAGYDDISRFKDIPDGDLVKYAFGSYGDFSLEVPQGLEGVFARRSNYVFDKY